MSKIKNTSKTIKNHQKSSKTTKNNPKQSKTHEKTRKTKIIKSAEGVDKLVQDNDGLTEVVFRARSSKKVEIYRIQMLLKGFMVIHDQKLCFKLIENSSKSRF